MHLHNGRRQPSRGNNHGQAMYDRALLAGHTLFLTHEVPATFGIGIGISSVPYRTDNSPMTIHDIQRKCLESMDRHIHIQLEKQINHG
jgi:hypothetical protein